jgi:hypothetical protein
MALTISAVQVTGTATAYTVPAGKVAKVRLVSVETLANDKILTIGNYTAVNTTTQAVNTKSQSAGTSGGNAFGLPVTGFVRAGGSTTNMVAIFMYFKEDHVLVAGETVSCDDTGATVAYTIFEEDV